MERKLNVYVDKPTYYEIDIDAMHSDEYYVIDIYGNIISYNWRNTQQDNNLYQNTILYKDYESAKNYQEFMDDARRLHGKYGCECNSCYFVYDHACGGVFVACNPNMEQHRDYYYNAKNAKWLLEKYGSEFIQNWIMYCK